MEYEELLNAAMDCVGKKKCSGRFEVTKLNINYEGSNRTFISNFSQLASCIRREPTHIARFLYKNLASSGEISGERLMFGRKIPLDMIKKKVELYVNKYVICPKCGKPDTELIEENNIDSIRCLACCARTNLTKF